MNLMIVESAKKARTIKGFLGGDWQVVATIGHFRDLPRNPKNGIGVSIPGYEPEYEIQNPEAVARLVQAARRASRIYVATDRDREGEAIAFDVMDVLRLNDPPRVTFGEITEKAIREGIANARRIDLRLVNAQKARRVLDRMVGYMVSPLLGRGLSAGRVQSVGLRLVVEREREIEGFTPTTHYGVIADSGNGWSAEWVFKDLLPDEQRYWLDRKSADAVARTQNLRVTATGQRKKVARPPTPFITSTLQQAASSKLRIPPKLCMQAAQKLYEDGHITYVRTDSPAINEEALAEIRAWLVHSNIKVPEQPPAHKARTDAQEAHEAIRPTRIDREAAGDDEVQRALYQLIRNRTLASQMMPAIYRVTYAQFESLEVRVMSKPALFYAEGEELVVPGWKRIMADEPEERAPDAQDEQRTNGPLPPLTEGDVVPVVCRVDTRQTRPPPRYTEAALIRRLEREGIGRPSTYATIVSMMVDRHYVRVESMMLIPEPTGVQIVDALMDARFSFMNYEYTRLLENALDRIAEGAMQYHDVVDLEYRRLRDEIDAIPVGSVVTRGRRQPDPRFLCPSCSEPMCRVAGKRGFFWGCSRYPSCQVTLPDEDGVPVMQAPVEPLPEDGAPCPKCERPLRTRVARHGARAGQRFLSCSGYPECDYILNEREPEPVEPVPGDGDPCPKCDSPLKTRLVHSGPKAGTRFLGCSGFPKCKYSIWPDSYGRYVDAGDSPVRRRRRRDERHSRW